MKPNTPSHPLKVLRAEDFQSALAIARSDPTCHVQVFTASWAEVDFLRTNVAGLGLSARIGIHHQSALDALIELKVFPPSAGPPTFSPPRALMQRLNSFIRAAAASLAAHFTPALIR